MIVIVDYGVGNLASVSNMLRKVGAQAKVSGEAQEIGAADKVLLPGVGHFDHAMRRLRETGLDTVLHDYAASGKPILGICLGAQILGKGSEEGTSAGLGWIDMVCRRFPPSDLHRTPHMGWNALSLKRPCGLFPGGVEEARFYFVHSYYMTCADPENVVATASHGLEFTWVVQRKNIFGTQFHPEKSLRHGLALMKAFVEL